MIIKFQHYLSEMNLSDNTISAYLFAVKQYQQKFGLLDKQSLKQYKLFLLEKYKPQTVNLRLRGINCFLDFNKKEKWKLAFVKIQQKPFLENVISEADYHYFKKMLKQDNQLYWYFVIRFMAATGSRISELIQIKCEHIRIGYIDLYSKGGKLRRIYIPSALQKEAIQWLSEQNKQSGFIFINRYGNRITAKGISSQLKVFAKRYKIDPKVVYPHSFRHRFAKSFLERCNDISFLADLMGHESIDTTRIYLRKTSTEQQEIVNKIIDW